MPFQIEVTDLAETELSAIHVFDRRRIVDVVREQLTHQPTVETRNRKRLDAAAPAFDHVAPVWELRVGDYRVFYDVNAENETVYLRAVRLKQQGQTTEEIIHETDDT
jgi:mRNA-degrading endonuclease RelE of RelBE toxin-antitoxin system